MRWLSRQVRPYLPLHFASFFCTAGASVLALITPLVLKWLIDTVVPRRQFGLILVAAALIFVSYFGKNTLTNLGNYLTLAAVQKMSLHMRMDLLRHVDRLSARYYDSTPPGVVMYPLKEPVDEVAYFGSDLLPSILHMCLAMTFTVTVMIFLSSALSFAMLAVVPFFLIARQHFRGRLEAQSDVVQENLASWNSFLAEHISAVLPIKLLGREYAQERRAFRFLGHTCRSYMRLFRTGLIFTAWTSVTVVLAMCVVIGYGGWKVLIGTLSLGSLIAFYSFVTQLFDPLSGASELYTKTQRTFASIRTLQAFFSIHPTVMEPRHGKPFPRRQWSIDFHNVEFSYETSGPGVCIPTLRILSGEILAITGENGAGKSTFAKLAARVYDVQSGTIWIGDTNIREIHLQELRDRICYLPRDPVLFDGTLESNLRFIRPGISRTEMVETIQRVGLLSTMRPSSEILARRIGPNGCQLSGGQRQRLAIARAMLQRPHILILDEASSCIDSASEKAIVKNLRLCLPNSTLIMVSHRSSILSDFGHVIVFAHGRISEVVRNAYISQDPSSSIPSSRIRSHD